MHKLIVVLACLLLIMVVLPACNPLAQTTTPATLPTYELLPSNSPTLQPSPIPTPSPSPVPAKPTETAFVELPTRLPSDTPAPLFVRFAVIGDYGSGKQAEADVAALVKNWEPEIIITTGDNNYPAGKAGTIDKNIGQYFHEFIAPYVGSYGEGAQENRFFPSLGNHDWATAGAEPYLEYFELPGNERYYDFTWGPIHFFALDSDSNEPDGVGRSSQQAAWFQSQIASSSSPWKVVFFHHAPYSSGHHGSVDWMQWPFAEWGADIVLSGHDHTYERISRDGVTYFVNGLGGRSRYDLFEPVEGSQVRYNADYGAMLVEASEKKILLKFINRQNEVIDVYQLEQ